jgi:lipopolysaccharide assembly outer membrane protein LptD (OstA)
LCNSFAQAKFLETNSNGNDKIRYFADSLIGSKGNFGPIREYFHNVRILQNEIKITCNYAIQYLMENRSDLQGNVVFVQNEMTLKAPKVSYDGNSKKAKAYGGIEIIDGKNKITSRSGNYDAKTYDAQFFENVVMENDSALIYSDYATYNRKTKVTELYGNVYVSSKFSNSKITCDTLISKSIESYSIAYGNPILQQIDTNRNQENPKEFKLDTMIISSKVMESYKTADEYYKFKDSVQIFRENMRIKSGFADLNRKYNRIKLLNNPKIWLDNTLLYSDSITIMLAENKIKSIYLQNAAVSASIADTNYQSRINQVLGDEIFIKFYSGKINTMESYTNSKSLYYLMKDSIPDGASVSACDTINVSFEDGKPSEILWLGKVVGDVFPENKVEDNPNEYYLPRFVWYADKPLKKALKSKFIKKN